MKPRVLVIGLDCVPPAFVLGRDAFDLPHLGKLARAGKAGPLRSCVPPITVPAWTCITTGVDPGSLGCYGFRNRRSRSELKPAIATGSGVVAPRVWDRLAEADLRSIVVGVPQTYPPRPIAGWLVSGLLTPDTSVEFTHPAGLKQELLQTVGDYRIDVEGYRERNETALFPDLLALMRNRFDVAAWLMENRPWDFAMVVDIATDRFHHRFWHDAQRLLDWYQELDRQVGRLLDLCDMDTTVIVCSDHGAQDLRAGFAVNQWLLDQGYLVLRHEPESPCPLDISMVDWSRTRAWAWGGYAARVFLNVAGREPNGIVAPQECEALRRELAHKLGDLALPGQDSFTTEVFVPEDIYAEVAGVAPDLIVHVGSLACRVVERVGVASPFLDRRELEPDGANHALDGLAIVAGPGVDPGALASTANLLDVTPTVLDAFGLAPAPGLSGASLRKIGIRANM